MKIDLGGNNKTTKEGFKSVNFFEGCDIKHDLNKLPYPFDDNSVDEIYSRSTIEHLKIPTELIYREALRILKPECIIKVIFPNMMYVNYRLQYILGQIPNYFEPAHERITTFETEKMAMWNAGLKPMMKKWHMSPIKMFYSHITLVGKKSV